MRGKGKHSFRAEDIAQKFQYEPLEILLMIAHGDWKALGLPSEMKTIVMPGGDSYETLQIAVNERQAAARDAAKYLYSPRSSVTVTVDPIRDALEVTPQNRSVEQLKQIAEAAEKELEKIKLQIAEKEKVNV